MTEEEWLMATDPGGMLAFVGGRASQRKLRLFAVACCRALWNSLVKVGSQRVVEALERLADGKGALEDFQAWVVQVGSPVPGRFYSKPHPDAPRYVTAGSLVGPDTTVGLVEVMALFNEITPDCDGVVVEVLARDRDTVEYASPVAYVIPTTVIEQPKEKRNHQVGLVRDIFGPFPFRTVTINSSWLVWNDATIPRIAQSIYDDRRFDDLPILADALEEAGCSDADILGHCRGPGPHVRGCWVVDLILGRS